MKRFIGEMIRMKRIMSGMKQKDLAERLGISSGNLSSIERNHAPFQMSARQRAILSDLFCWDEAAIRQAVDNDLKRRELTFLKVCFEENDALAAKYIRSRELYPDKHDWIKAMREAMGIMIKKAEKKEGLDAAH